jgi:hypothetical protein
MSHTREQHREMILSPLRWPRIALPLVRDGGGYAVFFPQTNLVNGEKPIEIIVGAFLYNSDAWDDCERKTYTNVDALLDDGWLVD